MSNISTLKVVLNVSINVLKVVIPLLVCLLIIKNNNLKSKTKRIYLNTVEGIKAELLKRKVGYFSYIKIDNNLKIYRG